MSDNRMLHGVFFRFICMAVIVAFISVSPGMVLAAEDGSGTERPPQPALETIIVPECAISFDHHTYAIYQVPGLGWEEQEEFCERLGAAAGVYAHLAVITSSEENEAIRQMRPYASIGASESGGVWTWVDGTPLGRQVLSPNAGGDLDFIYVSEGFDGWCTSVHGEPHSGQQAREPDSFVPYLGECYASFNADYGWHNGDRAESSFICEFERDVHFIYAETNFDHDFSVPMYPYDGDHNLYLDSPGLYEQIGDYLTVKPLAELPETLEKQPGDKYPIHPDRHWNFRGWSYKSESGEAELFGHATGKDQQRIWDYNSKNPLDSLKEPILALHAVWEDANDAWKDGPDVKADESRYLALSLVAGIMGYAPKDAYNGMTVGQMLNHLYAVDLKTLKGDMNEQLARVRDFDNNPNITVLDFVHASVGGWTVGEWEAGDLETDEWRGRESGWSFFAVSLSNPIGKNAIAYRGTDFRMLTPLGLDSVRTDLDFGYSDKLNTSFDRAVTFFRDHHDGQTFVVGHSLGGALASHVALTENVMARTINSAEGWTIPLTVRQNYLTRDFAGNDTLEDLLHPYIHIGDAVGTHARKTRTRTELFGQDQGILDGLARDHLVGAALYYDHTEDGYQYGNGLYSIAVPVPAVYHEAWESTTGAPGFLDDLEDKTIYLGTTGADRYYHFYGDRISTGYYDVPSSLMYSVVDVDCDSFMFGGDGDDTLIAGYGKDTLIGGRGSGSLDGGPGRDIYVIKDNPGATTYLHDPDCPGPYNAVYVEGPQIAQLPGEANGYAMLLSDGQKVIFDKRAFYNTSIYLCRTPDDASGGAEPILTLVRAAPSAAREEPLLFSFVMRNPEKSVSIYDGEGRLVSAFRGDFDGACYEDYGYVYTAAGKGVEVVLFDPEWRIRVPPPDGAISTELSAFLWDSRCSSPLTEYSAASSSPFDDLEISVSKGESPWVQFTAISASTGNRRDLTGVSAPVGDGGFGEEAAAAAPVEDLIDAATPTASKVLVNGRPVSFNAYTIDANNYFKLRDLAYVLSGTEKQFDVAWNGEYNSVILASGRAYTAVGGEMATKGTQKETPLPTDATIFIDGIGVPFTAYLIDGNNYFKLRDIGAVFDFDVTWDGDKNTITIDTSTGYTPD